MKHSHFLKLLGAAALLVASSPLSRGDVDERFTKIRQSNSPWQIEIDFRLDDLEKVAKAEGFADGDKVVDGEFTPYAQLPDRSAAVAFVLDITDSRRRSRSINEGRKAIHRMIESLDETTEVAIYALGARVRTVSEFGSDHEKAADDLDRIELGGLDSQATLIYTNCARIVLDDMSKLDAQRKALVLLTDGKDESVGAGERQIEVDKLVDACDENKVLVHTIGYAERPEEQSFFALLIEVAARTKGVHLVASLRDKELPAAFYDDFPSYHLGGGRVVFDGANAVGKGDFYALVHIEGGSNPLRIPDPDFVLKLDPNANQPASGPNPKPKPKPNPNPKPKPPPGPNNPGDENGDPDETPENPPSSLAAADDVVRTPGNKSVKIDVTKNDANPDGATLTVDEATDGEQGGKVVINPDGTITYTPKKGFKGEDRFNYKISDGQGAESTGTVVVKVTEPERDVLTWILIGLVLVLVLLVIVLMMWSKKKREAAEQARMQEEMQMMQGDMAAHPVLGTPAAAPAPPRVLAWLELYDAEQTRIPITAASVKIGRGKDDEVRIPNESVSRGHCVMKRTPEGRWLISDLESGNGVLLNGNRVEQSLLVEGDEIELGEVRMRLRLPEEPQSEVL